MREAQMLINELLNPPPMTQNSTLCDNCGISEKYQALVEHGDQSWCLDCMRLVGHCIYCDTDIRLQVEDYFNYEHDECPVCLFKNSIHQEVVEDKKIL